MAGDARKRARARGAPGSGPEASLTQGDCLEALRSLEDESVDAILTDPPYGIGFNHERWDSAAIREAAARAGRSRLGPNEAFQAWCGMWAEECRRVMKPGAFLAAFGSPRTHHRLAAGIEDAGLEIRDTLMWLYSEGMPKSRRYPGGRATTLKPAFEPIVLARKPLAGTTEETIERFGTGGLNAEACRVEGRHPANVAIGHDPGCEAGECAPGCAVAAADERAAEGRSRLAPSRFLYCPKASRAERDAGCERLPERALDLFPNRNRGGGKPGRVRNPHPTVKPIELMRWLVRLLCPPGGLVLDPFCGSGTTGAAAVSEGRGFRGIELEAAYAEIARARIEHWRGSAEARAGRAGRRPLGRRRG